MKPYYDRAGVVIYHGDARDVVPRLSAVSSIITDPVWPDCEGVFPGIDAPRLLAEVLENVVSAERVVIQIGCWSDPRFLASVPEKWPFIRACWLEYACPSHRGRILNTGELAYAFGSPPPSREGARVLPGKVIATKKDAKFGHPTPRKMEHSRWLVKWFGGDSILDPFCGSGANLRAAKDQNIPAIGVEIEERYCESAAKRLEQDVLL